MKRRRQSGNVVEYHGKNVVDEQGLSRNKWTRCHHVITSAFQPYEWQEQPVFKGCRGNSNIHIWQAPAWIAVDAFISYESNDAPKYMLK
jgi:hypothetical protein